MMSDDELTEAVQHTLMSSDILTPRERAEQSVALIGKQLGQRIGGVIGAYVWGATSVPRQQRASLFRRVFKR